MAEVRPHPLLLSPVIHNVMEFLSIRDLISSRLVCVHWNTAACSVLRKTKTLKFRMQPEHLQDYIDSMKESKDFPYSHYELEFYHMDNSIVQNFLHTCGKSITSLQLNNCRCTTARLWEILLALNGNLRRFSLNCDAIIDNNYYNSSNDGPDNRNGKSPIPVPVSLNLNLKALSLVGEFSRNQQLIHDLLKFSSKLESIEFRCYDNFCEISAFETMCYDQVFLQESILVERLTSFQMKSKLNNNQILSLAVKNLKNLTSLCINLDSDVRPEPLLKLLASLAKNLKKLDLSFFLVEEKKVKNKLEVEIEGDNLEEELFVEEEQDNIPSRKQYIFPAMKNLLRLTLSNYDGSLAFVNDCKKLMYLALVNCDVTLVTLAQVRKHPLKSLVSTTTLMDCAVWTKLAQVFPDLKELNVELNDSVLRTVFQIMPELEELTIFGDKVTDDGITGVDNVYAGINTVWNNMDVESGLRFLFNYDNGTTNLYRKFPFVANLTKLRKIKIQNAGSISDASVVHGLILCNNLSEISLLNSKVTDYSLRAIADNLPQLKKLETLSYLQRVTSKGKEYIRTKLTGCDFILSQQDIIYLYRARQVRTC